LREHLASLTRVDPIYKTTLIRDLKGHETHRLYLNGVSHSRCNMPAGITTTLEKCTRVEVYIQ
jgi:hypothetical protein